ncbi:MAG: hypothetical protein OJJ55_10170 [Rhodococcus sp.]|uniref:hypothetical protein n=1 Tax=Rhodococcus sp. PvP104 TaxID=2817911 RepID=UPI001AE273CE|nr:hypothetical protein [Rhodococcus sp. PvP104]MBP2520898.1 GAF domain-containing protein [Rhodococcus sp. PvP104]MCW0191652.1 hypothetical protein [Rhodococcus sp. (in: high G+C Gram-positive bacteria)]
MDQVGQALAQHRRAEQRLQATRDALHEAIRVALGSGEKQVDLVRRTGYSREYIRRIAREMPLVKHSG